MEKIIKTIRLCLRVIWVIALTMASFALGQVCESLFSGGFAVFYLLMLIISTFVIFYNYLSID